MVSKYFFSKVCFLFLVSGSMILFAASPRQYGIADAFPDLPSFNEAVHITNAGDGSNRLFVVEQSGVIRVFDSSPGVSSASVFLDISDKVLDNGEMGLLSVAFHPQYASNGYIYVNYVAPSPRRTVISRFTVNPPSSNQVDTSSEYIIMEISQPYENHNGGQNAFGPDGYLYIGMGDGGSGGDPEGNAQNLSVLLGKMLRINVDSTQDSMHYAIPSDNPFAGNGEGIREEIWAYGLRNPWRFSFDPVTGWLYCGDVGQDKIEEIDVIWKGKNYGWNTMEASKCYDATRCDTVGLVKPIKEYTHSKGVSVTGGFVYRGPGLPSLQGNYIYADFGSGIFWGLQYDGVRVTNWRELFKTGHNISSFGVDEQNEMYILSYYEGRIYKFIAETIAPSAPPRYRTLTADSTLSMKPVKIAFRNGFLLSVPGASTAVENLFKKLKNKPTTFLGIKQTAMSDANQYAWISYMKSSDLGKLYTTRHDTLYYPLDSLRGTRTIKMKKAQRANRTKFNNAAVEQGVVFRLNLLLSDSGITPAGFGNLILDTSVTLAGREMKGLSLESVADFYDSVMTYWQMFGINTPSAYDELKTFVETVLRPINYAFASEIRFNGADYAVNSEAVKKNMYAVTLGGYKTAVDAGLVKEPVASEIQKIHSPLKQKPIEFSAYPNPFNPATVIRYSVPLLAGGNGNMSPVELKIFNILGQEVATLVNDIEESSDYSVEWNASNSPAGIYFAELNINGIVSSKKLLLLK